MSAENKQFYSEILSRIDAVCSGETDHISLMASIACELFHGVPYIDWAGFYRVVSDNILKIGPYQGGHGCIEIPFSKGVCGKCASDHEIQIVPDVTKIPYHIACASSTRSEIVLPITDAQGELIAVLDLDSDTPDAFDQADADYLIQLNTYFT